MRDYEDVKYLESFPFVPPRYVIHSKSLRKNVARVSGGANKMHPLSWGGGVTNGDDPISITEGHNLPHREGGGVVLLQLLLLLIHIINLMIPPLTLAAEEDEEEAAVKEDEDARPRLNWSICCCRTNLRVSSSVARVEFLSRRNTICSRLLLYSSQ